jgi:hypothetical protein
MHFFHFYSCSSNLFVLLITFFCKFFKPFSTDLKSAWNAVFWYISWFFQKKKNCLGHNSISFKISCQTPKKWRQKSKNILRKCVLEFNFAPIKGSVFLIFYKKVKFVVAYSTVYKHRLYPKQRVSAKNVSYIDFWPGMTFCLCAGSRQVTHLEAEGYVPDRLWYCPLVLPTQCCQTSYRK